jgi:GT2 family glycosyltransferase
MIAIGSIVRNRAWILPKYLQALQNIDYNDKFYMFLENDSDDNTFEILYKFHYNKLKSIKTQEKIPNETRKQYNQDGYSHLANIRNKFLEMFLETDADYLLSIDSDIIVPSDILTELLKYTDNNTIVGASICNIPNRELDGSIAGNFMIEINGEIKHPNNYPLSGVMEVDVIGAVYLIPRKAIEDGIRYGSDKQGEDIYFCRQAKSKGYKLLVDLDCKPKHYMVKG